MSRGDGRWRIRAQPSTHGYSRGTGFQGSAFRLQFRAGVGVNFAIQANFFKSRSCPFHNFPQSTIPRADRELVFRISDPQHEINTSRKNMVRQPAFRNAFWMRSIERLQVSVESGFA